MPGRTARRRMASLPQQGANGSIDMPRARRTGPLIPSGTTWAAHPERRNMIKTVRATTSQTVTANKPGLDIRRTISLDSSLQSEACNGSGETTSVIDAINRRASRRSFPVLILTVPNNPIRHSCAQSDYNCGATLIDAGMCVHVFSIEFACLRGRWSAPLCKISF